MAGDDLTSSFLTFFVGGCEAPFVGVADRFCEDPECDRGGSALAAVALAEAEPETALEDGPDEGGALTTAADELTLEFLLELPPELTLELSKLALGPELPLPSDPFGE